MNLIILGPQGSGKGTQARLLAEKLKIDHYSVGDLLRQEVKKGTKRGQIINDLISKGNLAPTPIILKILKPVLLDSDGFILDGFPRNMEQAEYFDKIFKNENLTIDKVIFLTLSEDSTYQRLLKRAKIEGRKDDTPEAIKKRLAIYNKETLPVINYFKKQGKVIEIDGEPDIKTIHKNILSALSY